MKITDRIRRFFGATLEDIVSEGRSNSLAGIYVSEQTSMTISAVYACVRLIAEDVASLPFTIYKRLERGKEKAADHQLYPILRSSPNGVMTAFGFLECMMTNLLLWGNAYAQIIRNRRGEIHSMEPLSSAKMRVGKNAAGEYEYSYTTDRGLTRKLTRSEIFHVAGISYDGILGMSPIAVARECIGLAKATEVYANNFFANGAKPGGILQHPGVVKDPERVRKSWEQVYRGAHNAHKIAVLEEGMTYKEISIPQKDAQFLETRQFQLNEICRIFRVPPHLVGDLSKATFSNIEHQSIDYVVHTLRPWLVRWEQAVNLQLLDENDRAEYYAKFNADGLLRGDFETRMKGYATGIQNGFLSPNDVRELEDMNPAEGGDVYLVNGNMKTIEKAGVTE